MHQDQSTFVLLDCLLDFGLLVAAGYVLAYSFIGLNLQRGGSPSGFKREAVAQLNPGEPFHR